MIKDPLNTQETPYDILEIDINTPMNEIHKAIPKIMGKYKIASKIQSAHQASIKLKNIHDRITYDITYYEIELMEFKFDDSLISISELVSKQVSLPSTNPSDYLIDLLSNIDSIDLPEFNFQTMEIRNIKDYNTTKNIQLTMPLERIEHHEI